MIWFVLLVLWPLAELFVIVKLSEAIGFLWVLLLLIISWPIGTRIIKHEGRAALRRLREALAAGREPTNEVLDGALVLVGGLLLLVPGFITDAIGLLLLVPPDPRPRPPGRCTPPSQRLAARALGMLTWGVYAAPEAATATIAAPATTTSTRRRSTSTGRSWKHERDDGACSSESRSSATCEADLWGIVVGGEEPRAAIAGVS